MDISWQGIIDAIGASAVFSAVMPIIIGGGLAHFKPWLLSEEKLHNRILLKKETMIERLAQELNDIFDKSKNYQTLRGNPPNEPDLIGGFIKELFRKYGVFSGFEVLEEQSRATHNFLMGSAIFGVLLLLLVSLGLSAFKPWLAIICYITVILQVIAAVRLRKIFIRYEEHEKIV